MDFTSIIEQVAQTAIGILIANKDTEIDQALAEAAASLKARVDDSGTLIDDRVMKLVAAKMRYFADQLTIASAPEAPAV